MPLIKRSNFVPHPVGTHGFTLADVLYEEEGRFGPQFKFVFDSDETLPDKDEPYRINYWVTPVLNERSNLYKLIEAFGENPKDERWEAIESPDELWEAFGGKRVLGSVIHKAGENGPMAKLNAILPLPKAKPRETARAARPAPEAAAAVSGDKDNWDQ